MGFPWYAFYPEKYRRRTAGLTMVQDGCYRRLMDHYYETAEPLPANADELLRICRAFAPDEQAALQFILHRYFVLGDDGWHHLTIDEEIIKRLDLSKTRSEAGKKKGSKGSAKAEQLLTQEHLQSQSTSSLRSEGKRRRPSTVRSKMPEDWPSRHDRDLALAYWAQAGRGDLADRLEIEITKARAHHLGKGTRSEDWGSTWVTWYTRALEYNKPPANLNGYPTAKIHKVVQ